MTPSFGAYLGGSFAIIGIVCALGLGAYWLRRWIVPEFSGGLARLADATIGVALLVLTLQVLGTFSILRLGWIIIGCIAVGLGTAALGWRKAPKDVAEVQPPAINTWMLVIAVGVASFTVAEWTFPVATGPRPGHVRRRHDLVPHALRAGFAQQGSTVHLHLTDPLRLAAWFYPQSSELIHGAAIAVMQSDWLSPLINMGWLAIGLLAAWRIGRPYNVGPASLVAGALVLDSGVLIETQPGEGRNDIMAFAFLLAFVAFLINGHQRRAPSPARSKTRPTPTRRSSTRDL